MNTDEGFEEILVTDEDDVLFSLECADQGELDQMVAAGLTIYRSVVGKRYSLPDPTPEHEKQIALLEKGFAFVSEPLRQHMARWAHLYIKKGLSPIPIPPVGGKPVKRPVVKGWQNQRLTVEECGLAFAPRWTNLGMLLGEPSRGLTDVDIDAYKIGLGNVAIRFLESYMPDPTAIFGRYSAPNSHWLYYVPGAKTEKFQDVEADGTDGAVLLEIRSTGGQTIFPPSTHQDTGQRIAWTEDYEQRLVDPLPAASFRRNVAWCAAGVLLVKHYPPEGARNMPTKHLAALLAKKGWSFEEAEAFISRVAEEAHDMKLFERLAEVRATFDNHAAGKPVAGASGLEKDYSKQLALRLVDWLTITDTETAEKEEEEFEIEVREWPAPPAPEVFTGLVGDFVLVWEPHTEASPVALAVQFLVALGNAIGPNPYYPVSGEDQKLNIFGVLVGPTSVARKGQSWACVTHTFERVQLAISVALNTVRGLSTGEGLIFAVRDARSEPDKKTGEPKVVDKGVDDKRAMVFESEFASVLRRMNKEGNTLSEILRQAWDSGGNLGTMTRNAPLRATGAHISIVTHITNNELKQYLTDTSMSNGFANRFIFVATKRVQELPDPGRPSVQAVGELASHIARVIQAGMRIREMHRSPEAAELWTSMYSELTRTRTGQRHNGVVARAVAQVLRLSMIYALQDGSTVIEARHIISAKALWDYAERTSRFVFGDSTGDKLADFIFDALKKAGTLGLTQTELRFETKHVKAAKGEGLRFALTMLLGDGLVRRESAPRAEGQHPGVGLTTWFAVV